MTRAALVRRQRARLARMIRGATAGGWYSERSGAGYAVAIRDGRRLNRLRGPWVAVACKSRPWCPASGEIGVFSRDEATQRYPRAAWL